MADQLTGYDVDAVNNRASVPVAAMFEWADLMVHMARGPRSATLGRTWTAADLKKATAEAANMGDRRSSIMGKMSRW